jgi:hypothetical protein
MLAQNSITSEKYEETYLSVSLDKNCSDPQHCMSGLRTEQIITKQKCFVIVLALIKEFFSKYNDCSSF